MSVQVYCGNNLEGLACRLASSLYAHMPDDPFRKTQIVTHSSGMARWLRLELAKHGPCRVAANLDILFPGNFFQKWVFDPMAGSGPEFARSVFPRKWSPPFNAEAMKWLIMKELESGLEEAPEFSEIAAYVGSGSDPEIRRYQIALRIADLFDRYMTYRPDMLKRWYDGETDAEAVWQPLLWRAITGSAGETGRPYAELMWEFLECGNAADVLSDLALHGAVYFFGVTATPPAHFAMLQRISETVPVHFFWLNPCRDLWDWVRSRKKMEREIVRLRRVKIFERCADLGKEMEQWVRSESGNPLLGSLGRIGRDLHKLLVEESGEPEAIFQEDRQNTLLAILRNDILDNVIPDPRRIGLIPLEPDDDSIRIHNCFGPLREVEALHDDLLRAFDRDPDLKPGDILVYVPDLETYAPVIESVFGASRSYGAQTIPFTIADRTLKQEYPVCSAFLSIMKTLSGRFKANEILALWSFQEIRNAAAVSDEDWDVLNRLLKNARVAWGIDEVFREHFSVY